MNFLAHIYLSGRDDKTIIGNFIGDFVKGNQILNFEKEVMNGILLHREIDRFTDDHPIVLESKKRLWEKYHHYSPVIVDVYYDHFLAANWANYHDEPLQGFTEGVYDMLEQNHKKLPERVIRMLYHMKKDNWLYHYQTVEGIRQTLTGMARRTRFKSSLENAHEDLKKDYDHYKSDFESFFPELIQHSGDFLSSLDS
ncbi:MAG: ACP phosphodiesterase [Cyclobacteriaceae bacterium]